MSSSKRVLYGFIALLASLSLQALTSCSPTSVKQTSEDTGALPRPQRVLVYDFAVSADEVELDTGWSAELEQKYHDQLAGPGRTEDEIDVGHRVADAVSEELVNKIRSYGLRAERAYPSTPYEEDSLMIRGQFLTIDQGNRTERVAIGFGAGRTEVQANVQVYEVTPSGKEPVETLQASGDSDDKPGMLEMMGIGALTHHLLASTAVSGAISATGEMTFETVQADGKRLAEKVAADLGGYFVSQGWIPPESVK